MSQNLPTFIFSIHSEKREMLGDRVYQRALHVVSEIERCMKASQAMIDGDLESLGRLMYQSHVSLRDLYEVSCPELDQLVDITMQSKGVLGSRMTGGGFGGCVVALVRIPPILKIMINLTQLSEKTPPSNIIISSQEFYYVIVGVIVFSQLLNGVLIKMTKTAHFNSRLRILKPLQ